jgi:hypothetical protein
MGGYNGWSNYETWNVKLWMDNDEGSYDYWREQTASAKSTYSLSQQLKDEHEEALPELSGFASDLLTAAFGEVNWYEIAEALIVDHKEEEAE